nr:MAG TPA: hypothetical protein [Bacteriophage sp.]
MWSGTGVPARGGMRASRPTNKNVGACKGRCTRKGYAASVRRQSRQRLR